MTSDWKYSLYICFFTYFIAITNAQIAPGAKTAMQEAMLGEASFKLRIHAPQQTTQDILDSLDSLLKIEEAVRRGDEEDFVAMKQRLLQIHKNRISEIVLSAFEPVHLSLPNPVKAAVNSAFHS